MRNTHLAIAALLIPMLTGCLDIDIEIPVATGVATVQGNEILAKANATLHGDILQPAAIDKKLGLDGTDVTTVHLSEFSLLATEDALADDEDLDDLSFVAAMTIFVRSTDEASNLPEIAVAWYYRDEVETEDFSEILFDVDAELELLPYVEEGFELFSKSVGAIPTDDVSVEGIAVFIATN